MWDRVTKGVAACAGAAMGLWCALPAAVQTLAVFMAADYATGPDLRVARGVAKERARDAVEQGGV